MDRPANTPVATIDDEFEKALSADVMGFETSVGRTKIHQHRDAEDIEQILRFTAAHDVKLRMNWTKLSHMLNEEWPDLNVSPKSVQHYMETYVLPHVILPMETHRRSLIEAIGKGEVIMDAKVEQGRIAKDLRDMLKRIAPLVGTEDGPSYTEYTQMSKAAQQGMDAFNEYLATLGLAVAPEKKSGIPVDINIKVDGAAASGGFFRGAPIDAKFEEK